MNQKGFAQFLLIIIVLIGIGITVYLTQFTQVLKPKAAEPAATTGKWDSMPNDEVPNSQKPAKGIDTFLFVRFGTKEEMVTKMKPFAGKFSYFFPDIDYSNPQRKNLDGTYTNAPFFEGAVLLKAQDPNLKTILGAGAASELHKSSMNYLALSDADFFHNPNGTPVAKPGDNDWRFVNLGRLETVDKLAQFWKTNTTQYPVEGFFIDSYGSYAQHFPDGCLEFGAQCKDVNFWYLMIKESSNRILQQLPPGKEFIFNGIFYRGTPDPGLNQPPGRMDTNFLDYHTGGLSEHMHRVIENTDIFESYLWAAQVAATKGKKIFFWVQPDLLTLTTPGFTFTKDINLERYYLAYYLLLQQKGLTFFGYHPDMVYAADNGLYYYRDWLLNFGNPLGEYKKEANNLYTRQYENGIALVNNSNTNLTYTLPQGKSYREWDPISGGLISGIFTVPPKSGKFLFNPLITPPGTFTLNPPQTFCSGTNSHIRLSWTASPNGPNPSEDSGYFVYINNTYKYNAVHSLSIDDPEAKTPGQSYNYKIEAVTPRGKIFSNEQPIIARDCSTQSPSPSPSPSPSVSLKPGDIDGDNDVDIFDFNAIISDFGKKNDPITKADLDADDDVDIFDFNILIANFGK